MWHAGDLASHGEQPGAAAVPLPAVLVTRVEADREDADPHVTAAAIVAGALLMIP